MYAIAIFMFFAALLALYETRGEQQMMPAIYASSSSLAENMGQYRQSVINYVYANPTFQGAVSSTQLQTTAVSGFTANPLWSNYVQGNTVVVWASSSPTYPITSQIAQLAQGSVYAGTALNGFEVPYDEPASAPTLQIALPAAVAGSIPNGVPVWLAQVYP